MTRDLRMVLYGIGGLAILALGTFVVGGISLDANRLNALRATAQAAGVTLSGTPERRSFTCSGLVINNRVVFASCPASARNAVLAFPD